MEKIGIGKRISSNGYESKVSHYQAKRCDNCPLRGMCHKAKGSRKIEVNHRLNQLKDKARKLLTSEQGLKHRSKRPIEVEAVFGQLKSNNKFNRFTFKGLEKVEMEFLLMSLGHNFRKMIAQAGFYPKLILKIINNGLISTFKIKIYCFIRNENCKVKNLNQNSIFYKMVA